MQTAVVNLFGRPAAGKTKVALGLTYHYKQSNKRSVFAGEAAQDFIWDGRDMSNQKYIFAKQENRLFRLNGKADLIINDSPLLLPFIYATPDYPRQYFDYVEWCWNQYHNINILLTPSSKDYDPFGRVHSLEQSLQIQKDIEDLLNFKGINYIESDTDDRSLRNIINYVDSKC